MLDSKLFTDLLNQIHGLGVDYDVFGDNEDYSSHAIIVTGSKTYSLEIEDYENHIELYAFKNDSGNEITQYRKQYKSVRGALNKIKATMAIIQVLPDVTEELVFVEDAQAVDDAGLINDRIEQYEKIVKEIRNKREADSYIEDVWELIEQCHELLDEI